MTIPRDVWPVSAIEVLLPSSIAAGIARESPTLRLPNDLGLLCAPTPPSAKSIENGHRLMIHWLTAPLRAKESAARIREARVLREA